uniref:Uncharacterized protein n=1 Tax=Plectus sambesii TaxID=2011161 RepID=A0A914V9I9_9BILA
STVTFLENAAKLCVTGVPALASLLSYKASAVNALLPPSNSSPLANVPRCQTCHLAHHNPADHSVRLASNRRPNAKRLRRAIARQARQSASPFDKHVLACADRSSTPTVVLLCPGCGAENRIGRLTTSSTKKSTQLDDDARNEPSSSTVSIEPNHAVHARKRKRRKAAVDEATFNSPSVLASTPLSASVDVRKNNAADSSSVSSPSIKPVKRRSDFSKLQRQLAGNAKQSPNVSHDLFSFLNSLN